MNGDSVPRLVEAFFKPVRGLLDFTFAVGATYGAGRVAALCWRCWRGFRIYCLPLGGCARRDLKDRFGEWAVIVGATSGIGLAYAEELARRKMNVVLISKFYDDLVQLVAKIQLEHSVQAYGIHADFSLGHHVFQEIDDALKGFEIGILVNNVTVQYDHPQFFVLIPPQRLMQILDINVSATTVMAYMILPQMLERQCGAIINVCSQLACLPPSPLLTAYTASMVYVKSFSECLRLESEKRGIIVQTLLPGFVASPASCPSLFTPSPATYVRHALSTLGVATTTCGYWPHSLQSWLCCCTPSWLWVWLVSHLFRRQRLQCINDAKEQGTEQFTRRRSSSVVVGMTAATAVSGGNWPPSQLPALRRVSGGLGLTLRRSPSPKRKISTGTPASLAATPYRLLDPFHDDRVPGSIPSPIPESPSCPPSSQFFPNSSKLARNNYPPNTSTPIVTPGQGVAGNIMAPSQGVAGNIVTPSQGVAGNIVVPRRSFSSSSVPGPDAIHQRHRLSIRHSRVMVIPSLARSSRQLEPETPPPSSSSTAAREEEGGEDNHQYSDGDTSTTSDTTPDDI